MPSEVDVWGPESPGMQSGTGVPDPSLGLDTDRYIDYATGDFYVKINGAWVKQANFGGAGKLVLMTTATVGETLTIGLSLSVKRYAVPVTGAAVGDRLMLALTAAPQNGTLQDAYVSAAGTVSVGLLVPSLGIGAVISVPLAIYKVT
jgi:hypothetical protein